MLFLFLDMNKKGGWEWEEIGKLILVVVLLGILLLSAIIFKDRIFELLQRLRGAFGLPN
jgi:hypothetical protein